MISDPYSGRRAPSDWAPVPPTQEAYHGATIIR